MSIHSQADGFYHSETEEEYPYTVFEVERMLASTPKPTEKIVSSTRNIVTSVVDAGYIREQYNCIDELGYRPEAIMDFSQTCLYIHKFNGEKIDLSKYTKENGYVIIRVTNGPKQKGYNYKGQYIVKVYDWNSFEAYPIYEINQDDSQADGYNDKSGDYI